MDLGDSPFSGSHDSGAPGQDSPRSLAVHNGRESLTIERQLTSNTVFSVGYIGSLSRHLLAVHSVSPGNPALCLGLSQPQDVAPGSPSADRLGFGTADRRIFYGPGIDNYDMALRKTTRIKESSSLEFRIETFNTFNHAQFDGANSVDGHINDSTLGRILKSQPGRVAQLALKLNF